MRELEEELGGQALPPPTAHGSPASPADVVCSVCHRLFTWDDVSLQPAAMTFTCSACLASFSATTHTVTWSRVLSSPFTYVAASVVLAGTLFAFGVGNPGRAQLAADDMGKPWHRRRGGRLALRQAARAEVRAERLSAGGDAAEAHAWLGLAGRALALSAASWEGTEAETHARIGEAVLMARMGDDSGAFEILRGMAADVPTEHPARPAYLYHYGKAAISKGQVDAGAQAWNELLKTTPQLSADNAYSKMMDQIIELASNDRRGTLLQQQLTAVCDTGPPGEKRRRDVIREMESRGLPLPAEVVQKEAARRREEGVNAVPGGGAKPARKPIVIRHFD